jgi:hypothetical protein
VKLYNCALEAAAAGGGWRARLCLSLLDLVALRCLSALRLRLLLLLRSRTAIRAHC